MKSGRKKAKATCVRTNERFGWLWHTPEKKGGKQLFSNANCESDQGRSTYTEEEAWPFFERGEKSKKVFFPATFADWVVFNSIFRPVSCVYGGENERASGKREGRKLSGFLLSLLAPIPQCNLHNLTVRRRNAVF